MAMKDNPPLCTDMENNIEYTYLWLIRTFEHGNNMNKKSEMTIHVDSGANVHIVTQNYMFYKLSYFPSNVQEVSGVRTNTHGIGVIIIRFQETNTVLTLYPVHYMPNNPQNAFSPNSVNHYNKYKSIDINIL